ncbi:MAG: TonB-dependent receptor [Bacteroidota bacterium]
MKKNLKITSIIALALFSNAAIQAQNKVETDTTKTIKLDDVLVSAVRVTDKTPVTFSNVGKNELAKRNLGQDIPLLLNFLPSVVTTTDAGNGFGYTGIRVRGSDASRVNVTINGIPYNDSESSGTYWVNMPDFASSLESIQLQRGVGTSTNGAGAFGASLNMLTDSYAKQSSGEIANSFGSFNSRKHTVKFSTGLMNAETSSTQGTKSSSAQGFEIAGRLSNIHSDGYVDRATSDLKSYFLQGTYVGKTTLIKALVFGGYERTYQSWNGIDADMLANNPRFNTAGIYTDEFGNTRYYKDEVDNYNQDHYQLHWNEKIANNWNTNLAFHYTKGKGYYENYKEDADFAEYGLTPVAGQTTTDLVRRKWLDNDFYGTTFSANYKNTKLDFIVGGGLNRYEGKHFGNVIWARYASTSELGDRYYDNYGNKVDLNVFAKANYQLTAKWSLFGDLQVRNIQYEASGVQADLVNDTFNFVNPKAGLTYTVNPQNNFYFSYARANREPNRTDYENGNPKPEKLNDFELGWRSNHSKSKWNANIYYMRYKDQLVLTGELDGVGSPLRANSGDSYRLGLEIDAAFQLSEQWSIRPNVTLSNNKNIDFYFQKDGVLQNFGDTNIAYSPEVVAGNMLTFAPVKNLQFSFLSKFVGEQFMGNIDTENSKLKSYFVNDLIVGYEIQTSKVFKSIVFSGLVNNILDYRYVSNGYYYTYDDDFTTPGTVTTLDGAGYYPQAGINFLLGMTLKF